MLLPAGIRRFVGLNDALHQRVAHHVATAEESEGHTVHARQDVDDMP